ncbi:MAG: alpha/beta hydrolase [Acidimicrobiales bacterium]|nr:alpha/beta hydrolase [Acidimicrobiales bacterium]
MVELDGAYDEFGLLHQNAAEYGLAFDPDDPPAVRRAFVAAPSGHRLSAIVWGDEPAEIVFLHGGAQNAHTWDTVILALGRPAVAIDLPGHGHSDWRADKRYHPDGIADDVAHTIETLAPQAHTLVGMSLGGLTAVAALSRRPHLADRIAVIDVTPAVNREKASVVTNFIAGPEVFASFDEILERTIRFNPTRSVSSLRRGVLHNARRREDGTWVWRYDRFMPDQAENLDTRFEPLWEAFAALNHPMLFLKGGASPVVDEADLVELRRRKPDVVIEVVDGAGHSIQGDQPVELAERLARFMN